jgi:2'-5' RNA ligase
MNDLNKQIIRRQLTLFVDQDYALLLEHVRQLYNPVQWNLIACHVTLCREEEIENLDQVLENLSLIGSLQCTITFDKPIRFENNGGVLLPAKGENADFHALRNKTLNGIVDKPRNTNPHITLMHPRNSVCTDKVFHEIETIKFPTDIKFKNICLIEQVNGGKWLTLRNFKLS